jgi:PD-(D/E)XK nuclease superfamily
MHENEIGTLIVERNVIVELTSAEKIHPAHKKQVLAYLRLTGIKTGYLLDFGEGCRRINGGWLGRCFRAGPHWGVTPVRRGGLSRAPHDPVDVHFKFTKACQAVCFLRNGQFVGGCRAWQATILWPRGLRFGRPPTAFAEGRDEIAERWYLLTRGLHPWQSNTTAPPFIRRQPSLKARTSPSTLPKGG